MRWIPCYIPTAVKMRHLVVIEDSVMIKQIFYAAWGRWTCYRHYGHRRLDKTGLRAARFRLATSLLVM